MSAAREWSTAALTADLAAKLRLDQYLVVAEATLRSTTNQRADLLAMRRKLADSPMMIVEIKTARADLVADLWTEKWRGYLLDGAVVFAFPVGLADPKEIPNEAGVIVRVGQGWSWKRAPRWAAAPLPTPYLYRRMALTVSDQSASRARSLMMPRSHDLWHAARKERLGNGRRLAEIAQDVDVWRSIVEKDRAEFVLLSDAKRKLQDDIYELERSKRRLISAP